MTFTTAFFGSPIPLSAQPEPIIPQHRPGARPPPACPPVRASQQQPSTPLVITSYIYIYITRIAKPKFSSTLRPDYPSTDSSLDSSGDGHTARRALQLHSFRAPGGSARSHSTSLGDGRLRPARFTCATHTATPTTLIPPSIPRSFARSPHLILCSRRVSTFTRWPVSFAVRPSFVSYRLPHLVARSFRLHRNNIK